MKTFLFMSNQELSRYDIIKRLIRKEINGKDAAGLTGLSVRHIRRLKSEVIARGPVALIHGNRGKVSNRRLPEKERDKIVKLLHERYYDFWPTHASEKLSEVHGIVRDPKTIRQIMIDEKLWKPRKEKAKQKHLQWRQRKAHYGEMVQFDGSYEYWFEDRGEKCCLLLAVDDATGALVYGKFDTDEGVFPVFRFWRKYLEIHGKPMSIYSDRFSTYSMNHKTAKENPDTLTQFQRAMRELRIEPLLAHSSRAKGRVETVFGTLQNRLIKEMRLENISTPEEANRYLKNEFIPWYNAKYAVEARSRADLHNKLSRDEQRRLSSIFSRQKERVVQNDFTVSFKKKWFQLTERQPATVCKRDRVVMEEHADGSVKIRLRGKYLNYRIIDKGQRQRKRQIPWVIAANQIAEDFTGKSVQVGHF